MDFADASLVVLAEEKKILAIFTLAIFTLGHKDFKVYRTKKKTLQAAAG